jgi:hypothetical protein
VHFIVRRKEELTSQNRPDGGNQIASDSILVNASERTCRKARAYKIQVRIDGQKNDFCVAARLVFAILEPLVSSHNN